MIELISMLGGGLLRLLPELFSFFKGTKDQSHEYKMTQLQLEIDKARAAQQLDIIHANHDSAIDQADLQALTEALAGQGKLSGIAWVDAISASVRPVLTYWWCLGLYTAYKVILVVTAFKDGGATLASIAPVILTEFDRSIVGSIFAFWFVDRALRKTK